MVDPERCVACLTCMRVCPYLAPRLGEDHKVNIPGAVCMGCGSCAAECPAQAVTLRHYTGEQISATLQALLAVEEEAVAR